MNVVLPLMSTVVSLIFAGTVLSQFASRRRPHQLVWGIGLICYAASAFMEVLVGFGVWNTLVYRLWYLIGAYFVAAYLGMGTIYLLVPRRVGHLIMGLLVLGSLVVTLLMFTTTISLDAIPVGVLRSGALPNYMRLLTPIFNTFGAGALFLGAGWSAWVFRRKRIFPERVISNCLIAVGALFPSSGGLLFRLGVPDLFYVFEFLGVAFIFAGFLANYEVIASRFAFRPKAAH